MFLKTLYTGCVSLIFLCFAADISAETIKRGEWSFSMAFGAHRANLNELNKGLFKAPLLGKGAIFADENEQESTIKTFRFDKDLPESPNGAKAAFELQWHANSKHALIFGIGSWEKTSIVREPGEVPTQGAINVVNFERRAKISYSEYSIGWRYAFFDRAKYQFYFRSSFHEVFDIDYREDFVFSYISGSDVAGFRRIQVMEAQTAALFMGQLALGAEWFFRNWFSMGVEAGYLKGERSVQLRNQTFLTDFVARDNIEFSARPYGAASDGNLGYLSPGSDINNVSYRRMKLNFSGWQVMVRINIYY